MLNKNCIKTILNVKHTCIDKVTMLADTSIMIEVHATKGEQCRCGICGKKSKFYDNGNEGARTWRACDWAGHKVILVGPSCRVNCKEHGVVTCRFPWARHGSRFTRKFEEQTAWMAVNCSRVAVAAFMKIVQALLQEYKSIPVKIEGFHRILFASTEQKDRIGDRIHLEIVTDDCHESVKGFSHISPSCNQIDFLYSGQITDQSFRRADNV